MLMRDLKNNIDSQSFRLSQTKLQSLQPARLWGKGSFPSRWQFLTTNYAGISFLLPYCLSDPLWGSTQTRSTQLYLLGKAFIWYPDSVKEEFRGVLCVWCWQVNCSFAVELRVSLSWIPCWISLWRSSLAGGPGNYQLQAHIKSKSGSQWCCSGCSNAVPMLWGMWAPETCPDPGLATSWGSGYRWGWSPCPGNLTLHPCQGRFSCFCSSFWAGRHLCAKVWT